MREQRQPPLLSFRHQPGAIPVDLDRLVTSRMLIQANSGGGKSRALRYMLEQTHGQMQQIVLDPEGEFASLRERFAYVLVGRDGDIPADPTSARVLCRRLLEVNASAVIDLYDLLLPERQRFVKLFLEELISLPRPLWHPLMLVLDEAHVFCPERGAGDAESTEAVIAACTLGRKRGYYPILATQRIAKLHKDAAAELLNVLIGRTGLDVDLKRAGDMLGFDKQQRQILKSLKPGTFFAFGPAVSNEVVQIRTGDVQTTHPEPGSIAQTLPPPTEHLRQILVQLQDIPAQAKQEIANFEQAQQRIAALEQQLARKVQASPIEKHVERVEVPILTEPQHHAMEAIGHQLQTVWATLQQLLKAHQGTCFLLVLWAAFSTATCVGQRRTSAILFKKDNR